MESGAHVGNFAPGTLVGGLPSPFLTASPSPGPVSVVTSGHVTPVTGSSGVTPPGNVISYPPFGQCNKTYTKRDMSLALEALR